MPSLLRAGDRACIAFAVLSTLYLAGIIADGHVRPPPNHCGTIQAWAFIGFGMYSGVCIAVLLASRALAALALWRSVAWFYSVSAVLLTGIVFLLDLLTTIGWLVYALSAHGAAPSTS